MLLISLKLLLSLLLTLKLWEAAAGALEARYDNDNNRLGKINSKRVTSASHSMFLSLSIYAVEKRNWCYR